MNNVVHSVFVIKIILLAAKIISQVVIHLYQPSTMATNEITTSALKPVEGDVATLLRALRGRSYMSLKELQGKVERELNELVSFDDVWGKALNSRYVKIDNGIAKLTEDGEDWLSESDVEISVEIEDQGADPDDPPTKPYAVAKLKMETKHLSVFQALRKIEKKEIDLNPDFQRAFVWDAQKQSRLIESILIRIPLPAFYLDATDQIHWSVVDGLQRLTTLDRYCRGASFPLTGLQFLRELEGLRFNELPSKYQVLVEDDTQLLFYNLMPGTPVEAKFTIFSRVNTGGMQLTAQEIRHALNQGKVTVLLAELARHPVFRSITAGVVESLRMSDREIILRAVAFLHLGSDAYKEFGELDAFLLHAMAELNKQPQSSLDQLAKTFISSLEKVKAIFGKHAFRKFTYSGARRSPFNKALFEAWAVAVADYSMVSLVKRKDDIAEAFSNLIATSPSFERSISSSTSSYSAVSNRFRRIQKLLKEIFNDQ